METALLLPLPGLSWRPLQDGDLPAVQALAGACLEADGGLPLAAEAGFLKSRSLPPGPGLSIGAWDAGGRLVAAAAVQPEEAQPACLLALSGMVHPAWRGRGLGRSLLAWSAAQAPALLEDCPAGCSLQIRTEFLPPAAERLYARLGFEKHFVEWVMARSLRQPLPQPALPAGLRLETWAAGREMQFFEAYQAAFRERPGYSNWSASQWIDWIAGDDDFLPQASLLALDGDRSAGFTACGGDMLAQMGVVPGWRGRGLGAALLAETLHRLQQAGIRQVWLDVNENNPGAVHLYQKLGFVLAGRRGRYNRNLPPHVDALAG
jgi:mycothiol synthase